MAKVWIDIGEFGNPLMNVFGYQSNLVVLDEENQLADSIEAHLFPAMNGVMSSEGEITQLEIFKLNTTVYLSRVYTGEFVGINPGDPAPPFVAWSFKFVRAAVGKRSGGKRIGPIAAGDFVNRDPVPAALALLEDCAAAFAAPLQLGLIDTWFPVILERPEDEGDPWHQHGISGVRFEAVSTQNTRKK